MTWLNISLNGPREGLVWRGNVSQKMSKKMMKKMKILSCPKIVPISIFTSKITDFWLKSEVFQTNFSRSRASVGGALGDTGCHARCCVTIAYVVICFALFLAYKHAIVKIWIQKESASHPSALNRSGQWYKYIFQNMNF